ncbi:MAG: gamma-glutamylcyclotransferase [Alphaproteobacteria bacterium]
MWIFGYGSLMWNPGFAHGQVASARIFGWHRRFSLISTKAWGSEAAPGLCAALHGGGCAWGRIFEVPATQATSVLAYLDQREAAYLRRQVVVYRAGIRAPIRATTYVIDPDHPRFCEKISTARAQQLVRQGQGTNGTSLGYVHATVEALGEDGHRNTDAHRFFAMVLGNE